MDTWCGTPSLGTPDAPSTWYVSASGLSCTTEVGSPITVVTSSVVSSSSSASDSMISCQSSAGTGAVAAALRRFTRARPATGAGAGGGGGGGGGSGTCAGAPNKPVVCWLDPNTAAWDCGGACWNCPKAPYGAT